MQPMKGVSFGIGQILFYIGDVVLGFADEVDLVFAAALGF